MEDLEQLGSLTRLSAQAAYGVVKRMHKLAEYSNRLSLWAAIDEMQVFGYIRGLADPNAINEALRSANRYVLESLHKLTTKPLRPYANPSALVKIPGSRVSTRSFVDAIKEAQAKVNLPFHLALALSLSFQTVFLSVPDPGTVTYYFAHIALWLCFLCAFCVSITLWVYCHTLPQIFLIHFTCVNLSLWHIMSLCGCTGTRYTLSISLAYLAFCISFVLCYMLNSNHSASILGPGTLSLDVFYTKQRG